MKVTDFKKFKVDNKKITFITCYDYSFAKIVSQTNVDCVLVGDSLAMTMHGHDDTTLADIDMMSLHTSAVKKGLAGTKKFIVADMPFLSNRGSQDKLIEATLKLIQAGAQAVKIEGVEGNIEHIQHLVHSGVPVMGHIGLTPQFVNIFGGYKVQGKSLKDADILFEQAQKLQEAGCFSIVLECIPSDVAERISSALDIPTIGIGAGENTDGQVLVLQDLLGMNSDFKPKFVKQYLDGFNLIQSAINTYCDEVETAQFPNKDTSF
ncbi:3-methyl-2-oxobutanoate hydroxymethyltransferase [Francisellaceae bacterium]|nr:3-methyl-2-oxobutanoate hydroxymethyltransferase [Francisellaceae bacterium]